MDDLIARLRNDITVADETTPIVWSGIVPTQLYIQNVANGRDANGFLAVIEDLPNRVPFTAYASFHDPVIISGFDYLHTDTPGTVTHGDRVYDAWLLARVNMGSEFGSFGTGNVPAAMYQPLDADLTAIAALTTTSTGRDLLTAADAAAIRTKAGLGTIATQAASAVAITGGTVAGITDLAVADGGTGASSASVARTNLGVAIGTDVQAYNAGLVALAGLGAADITALKKSLGVPLTFLGQGTTTVTGTTSLTVVNTITIPANSLGPNGQLTLRMLWDGTGTTSRTLKGTFGGVDIFSLALTTSPKSESVARFSNINATNSQKGFPVGTSSTTGLGSSTGTIQTGSVDTTVNQDLVFSITLTNAADSAELASYEVLARYSA